MALRYVEADSGPDFGKVTVRFEETTHPGWEVIVGVERLVTTSPAHDGDTPDLWTGGPETFTRTRCTSVTFQRSDGEVTPSWVASAALKRALDVARQVARDLEFAEIDDLPPLPPGRPTRANRAEWYQRFIETLEVWAAMGAGGPMELYRQVARRKRVTPNLVKQWVHQARQLREAGMIPARRMQPGEPAVAVCDGCEQPITPGAVGRLGKAVFHPLCCPTRYVERLHIDEHGDLRPLEEVQGQ